jgi:hypothetical protein
MLSELIIQSRLVTMYTVRYRVVNYVFCRQSVLVCSVDFLKGTTLYKSEELVFQFETPASQ